MASDAAAIATWRATTAASATTTTYRASSQLASTSSTAATSSSCPTATLRSSAVPAITSAYRLGRPGVVLLWPSSL